MAYCGPRGIPLSTFLEWEPSDQEAALAWQAHEAQRCPGCGRHPDEGPRHYHVDICQSCIELERVRDSEDAKHKGAHVHGAAGSVASCARCAAEMRANTPRPKTTQAAGQAALTYRG